MFRLPCSPPSQDLYNVAVIFLVFYKLTDPITSGGLQPHNIAHCVLDPPVICNRYYYIKCKHCSIHSLDNRECLTYDESFQKLCTLECAFSFSDFLKCTYLMIAPNLLLQHYLEFIV